MSKKIYLLILAVVVVGLVLVFAPADRKDAYDAMSQIPVVVTPNLSEPIASPLVITGKARGNWYFEGSFPVELLSESGDVLGQGIATAQGEWMTEEYVPFTAEIIFTAPSQGAVGTLVLKKDNPSGLPEHDGQIEIPVRFQDVLYPANQEVAFGASATLKVGEVATFGNEMIVQLKEITDSRCKPNVQCVWAGELAARIMFSDIGGEMTLGTVNNTSQTALGFTFTLVGATESMATIKVSKAL